MLVALKTKGNFGGTNKKNIVWEKLKESSFRYTGTKKGGSNKIYFWRC